MSIFLGHLPEPRSKPGTPCSCTLNYSINRLSTNPNLLVYNSCVLVVCVLCLIVWLFVFFFFFHTAWLSIVCGSMERLMWPKSHSLNPPASSCWGQRWWECASAPSFNIIHSFIQYTNNYIFFCCCCCCLFLQCWVLLPARNCEPSHIRYIHNLILSPGLRLAMI